MIKKILLLALLVTLFVEMVAQGVTKYGNVVTSGADYVDENGKLLSSGALTIYGEILQNFNCPADITITHQTSGGIAPVDKTTTYVTVPTYLFGKYQCVITKNLGATSQAVSSTDATEAAAGWYWQFNRKEGFIHDGISRTPGTSWIYPIEETSEWLAENDPCAGELGTGWRIPTRSEWLHVDNYSGLNNLNDTYNSILKLHAAGRLSYNSGVCLSRGAAGQYWSSSHYDTDGAWDIYITGTMFDASSVSLKSTGFPLRCLMDCNAPPAPTGSSSQFFFRYQTVADLSATGVAIKWYASADGGNPLSLSTVLSDSSHYYASQMSGECESVDRLDVLAVFSACETSSVTIGHSTSGGVAPVDKTVTYNLVPTRLFGGFTCALTKNLGATSEAANPYDASEASAGWYWQFNRKQGYKHDGATRTPNSAWITTINESNDWLTANDPCKLELGTGWRIPTKTEWTNADGTGGNWANVTHSFGSVLKLHTAGVIYLGNLYSRGTSGYIWSSTSYTNMMGWHLYFNSGTSYVEGEVKSEGYPLRCLKDCVTPAAPTGQPSQYFYPGQTVADLTATGSGIKWYAEASGGTALATTTLLTNSTHYYANQTVGECEGIERLDVLAIQYACNSPSFTKNHLASEGVAPVDKTVIYNTATTMLFGGYKCALSQNLGAANQATSASDGTEDAAGWYWQFNLKQGYKHDGTTRTPGTAWTSFIEGPTDWLPENDPCLLELGDGWRIPTNAEWTNADNSGGWADYYGPYNSNLKLHAAGYISHLGTLQYRGSAGFIWSKTAYNANNGYRFFLSVSYSETGYYAKSYGYSIRCIKD